MHTAFFGLPKNLQVIRVRGAAAPRVFLTRITCFLNGKNFCLRGGIEHRELKLSQFKREVVKFEGRHKVRYTYTEYVSKNRAGGLKQLKQDNKTVHQYESENLERCHVLLLDKYISKLPEEAKKDLFHLRPKPHKPKDPLALWYMAIPVGRHTLSDMMKRMSTEAQLDQKYTNHSLRAYGVTKLFRANLPEKLIMERSGHRSIGGVRQYERTDISQELQVCQVLSSIKTTSDFVDAKKAPAEPKPTPVPTQPGLGIPSFTGCSFTNCVFQLTPVPPALIQPLTPALLEADEFSEIDLNQLLDF